MPPGNPVYDHLQRVRKSHGGKYDDCQCPQCEAARRVDEDYKETLRSERVDWGAYTGLGRYLDRV
jgi:hypothetical protein